MKFVGSMWVAGFLGACAWTLGSGCGDDADVFGESGSAGDGGSQSGSTQGSGAESTGARSSSSSGDGGSEASSSGATGGDGSTGPAGSGGSGGAPVVTCGDFVRDPSECGSCAPDCGITCLDGCGNGTCDDGETCSSCPADCQLGCGDGCCLLGEDCASCPADCATPESCEPGACGNGQCNHGLGETCLNCADCFGFCDCGDDVCTPPETDENCPWDCGG